MKKRIGFLFAIFLVFLTACGGNNAVGDEALGELTWPDSNLAALVPRPKSTIGKIAWEYDDKINILVGEVTAEDYLTYVNECKDRGFSEIEQEETALFRATNSDGYRLDLSFHVDESQMSIIISEPLYVVQLKINCIGNLIFSKYDVDVYVDHKMVGSIEHGGEDTYELELEKGTHTLRIENQDDSTIDGEVEFTVPDTLNVRCNVSCDSDQIEIDIADSISLPFSSADLTGKVYRDIEDQLKAAGFQSVTLVGLADLTTETMADYGFTASVIIDGNSDFSAGDIYYPDAEVIVKYHSMIEINPPLDSYDISGCNYQTVYDKFIESGFTNVTLKEKNDAILCDDGEVYDLYVDGERFRKEDKLPLNANIEIIYAVNEEEAPATTLSSVFARQAFRKYGEKQYPFGFDPHFFMDLRNEEQLDDGSWYIKVGVTITNAYGQEYDTVAEGIVSGTDDLAYVTQFYVS